jgi:hypothetical protein
MSYNSKAFVEKTLKIMENSDPLINLYFSEKNVEFIKKYVKDYVFTSTGININSDNEADDLSAIMLNMIELYYITLDRNNLKHSLMFLNKKIIEYYIQTVLSGIDSYIHYYGLISSPPSVFPLPEKESIRGYNTLSTNMGFESSYNQNLFNKQFAMDNTR